MKPALFLYVAFLGSMTATNAQTVTIKATTGKATNGTIPVTVSFTIPAGYHIYGPQEKNGVPTVIKVKGTDFTIAKVSYPKPKVIKQYGEPLSVYEKKVLVTLNLKPTKPVKLGQIVRLSVTTQTCNDRTCLPISTQEVTAKVKPGK